MRCSQAAPESVGAKDSIFASPAGELYVLYMIQHRSFTATAAHVLHVRLGRWFEATASGWGVVVVPIVLAAFLAAAIGFFGWP